MELTPDLNVFWTWGPFQVNETLVVTWAVMIVLVMVSAAATRRLRVGIEASRWQLLLEIVVLGMKGQIREAVQEDGAPYLPFIGTLFLFIAASALVGVVPGVTPPTASLSTAVALALAVFVAVPVFGVAREGVGPYLRHYVRPSPLMLPFHVVSELSRTLALAVRLFGNSMSGTLIVAILLSVVPFFLPVVMEAFGLLIGIIQAYVFAVLSLVYIASASRTHRGGLAGDGGRSARTRPSHETQENPHGSR